jgi:hypothetical protein
MLRIKPVDQNTPDPVTVELLNSVRKSMGAVPMPTWTCSTVPDTLMGKSARSWPTWR